MQANITEEEITSRDPGEPDYSFMRIDTVYKQLEGMLLVKQIAEDEFQIKLSDENALRISGLAILQKDKSIRESFKKKNNKGR